MRPHPFRAIALLLCLALPLGACGGDIVLNVYQGGGPGQASKPNDECPQSGVQPMGSGGLM